MKLNLNHNTVIRETVTDGFLRYFQESLVPLLHEKYGESICEVQMYESHLEKSFFFGGEWYYPLSLRTSAGDVTEWIAWEYPKGGAFLEMNPYAYVSGAPLAFRLAPDVPSEFRASVGEHTPFAPTDAMPISVGVVAGSVRMLAGKYSQSFLDALSKALTREIEKAHNVRGLATSGIRLEMLFAPMTYMEHTCEGVTYRRLTISEDGARTTKDFWVRWQRVSGNEPVTVSEEIREGEVDFFIGEDVAQKVREKEYRYLLRQNAEKYRSAMGRKTVTEWRELIKKALKRGALERVLASEPKEEPLAESRQIPHTYEPPTPVVETPTETTSALVVETPLENTPTPVAETYTPEQHGDAEILGGQELTENELPLTEPSAGEGVTPETAVEDDPWLARLKEYAGEQASTENEDPAIEENTDEFRDAMMRMRSILGIGEDEYGDDAPETALPETQQDSNSTEQESDDVPVTTEEADEAEEDRVSEPTAFDVPITEPAQTVAPPAQTIPSGEDKPVSNAHRSNRDPLFVKPVQQEFFADTPVPVPSTQPKPERAEPAPSATARDEAELRRQIRDGVLREIEMRERERLAEEARRAVIEKEEREAEMARIAQERMEAEASRRELEELREKTRVLSEELRVYTQMCMDIMNDTPVPEKASASQKEEEAVVLPQADAQTEGEQITFTVAKTQESECVPEDAVVETPVQSSEEPTSTDKQEQITPAQEDTVAEAQEDDATAEVEEDDATVEAISAAEQNAPKRYSFTEEELSTLLREHTERLEKSMLEQARRIVREELEKERVALRVSTENIEKQLQNTPVPTENSPAAQMPVPQEDPQPTLPEEASERAETPTECTETPTDVPMSEETKVSEETVIPEPQAQIADLLRQREQEEEQRRQALELLIREQEEKLAAMRREEEERRLRAEQLIAEQARLEELARIENERAQEENRRLEQERKRAEALALQSYEKHLVEAKRLEEELEAARRRREEEDLRIAEAERRIAEQTRLAEEAREQQRIKNEEARRLTEEAEQRLYEINAARERGRELAERTEEESRLMQQNLQQEEERLRADTLRREQEERQRIAAERLLEQRLETPAYESASETPTSYNYVSRVVHLYFSRAIDPNVISQIHRLMSDTIAYFNKSHVSISVRAEIVGPMLLDLNFIRIPKEEEPLLINIVKVLGRSNIGVRHASIDD